MEHETPAIARRPDPLAYEATAAAVGRDRQPGWVYAVVGVYALLVVALLATPAWFYLAGGTGRELAVGSAFVTLVVGAGVCLLLVPVRVMSRRPVTKRSLWFPIVGAAFLLGLLATGAALAWLEFMKWDEAFVPACLGLGAAVWLGWAIVFWAITRAWGPMGIGAKLHRWLIAGSVLELLVAVPTHVVVRRRTECCAGIYTGIGICVGVAVMIVSLGPGVLFLYRRRWKQVAPRR